jgi:hypothetical protein
VLHSFFLSFVPKNNERTHALLIYVYIGGWGNPSDEWSLPPTMATTSRMSAAMTLLVLLLAPPPTMALLGDVTTGAKCHDVCRANCNGWGIVCHLSCTGACAGSDGIGIMSIDEPTTTAAATAATSAPDSAPVLPRPRSHPHLHHRFRGGAGIFISPVAAPAPATADS